MAVGVVSDSPGVHGSGQPGGRREVAPMERGTRGGRYGCCDGWEWFPWAIAAPVGCRRATLRSGGHEDRTQACAMVRRWSAVLEPIRGRREHHWTHQMGRDIPNVLRQDGVVSGTFPTRRRQGYGSRRACAMASQVDIDFSYLAGVGSSSDGSWTRRTNGIFAVSPRFTPGCCRTKGRT